MGLSGLQFCHVGAYCLSGNFLSARKLASSTKNSAPGSENSEGDSGTTVENLENQSSEIEVVEKALVPASESPADTGQPLTPEIGTSNGDSKNSGSKNVKLDLPVIGEISMDYSQVGNGYVLLLCNGQPMFAMYLHFIFGSMTRNARKKICTWLQSKDLVGYPALPLPGPVTSTHGDSSSSVVSPSTPASKNSKAGDNGQPIPSQADTNENLTAVTSKLRILCGLLAHDFSQHSNSVFSSLKSWAGKNEVVLCTKENKRFVPVDLDSLIEGFVAEIKSKRKTKNSKGAKNPKIPKNQVANNG